MYNPKIRLQKEVFQKTSNKKNVGREKILSWRFPKTSNKKNGNGEVLHQGISKRYFERSFTIADDVKVIGAELKDGLLTVSLERLIPEEKKEKVIEIK